MINSESTSTPNNTLPNPTIQVMKQQGKAQPFGAHFTMKLQEVNNKLICALSLKSHLADDPDSGNN